MLIQLYVSIRKTVKRLRGSSCFLMLNFKYSQNSRMWVILLHDYSRSETCSGFTVGWLTASRMSKNQIQFIYVFR